MSRGVAIVLVLMTALAHATPKEDADKLWQEGRLLMDQNKYAEACDKFRASIDLVPDFSTQLNLGVCLDKLGRHADAWRLLMAAAEAQKADPDKYKYARDLANKVLPNLGTIVLTVAAPDAPGLRITIAGRDIEAAASVKEIVDPGDIKVTRIQTGARPYERTVHVDAGGIAEITVPVPQGLPEEVVEPPAEQPVGETHRRRSRVLLSYGVGGAGVVALGVGVALVVKASSNYDAQFGPGKCVDSSGGPVCPDPYLSKASDAVSLNNVGRVFEATGLVLIGVGAALWFTAPKDVIVTPTATSETAGISVVGRF